MSLAKAIFSLIKKFPPEEKYSLATQMSRVVVSIPSNIAEGSSRDSKKEFILFLNYALGSCFEFETQLILTKDFGYISYIEYQSILQKAGTVQKMIFGLKSSLKS